MQNRDDRSLWSDPPAADDETVLRADDGRKRSFRNNVSRALKPMKEGGVPLSRAKRRAIASNLASQKRNGQ